MLCSWEGNCRSDVTLAMHHRLNESIQYPHRLRTTERKMSTQPMPLWGNAPLPFCLLPCNDLNDNKNNMMT